MKKYTPTPGQSPIMVECEKGTYVKFEDACELRFENMDLRENYSRVVKEQRESFEHFKEAQDQFREGTWHGNTTSDYKESVSVDPNEETAMFSLAYQWQDKKHRHIFDLCDWVDKLQDEVKDFRELVKLLTIQEMDDYGRYSYPTHIGSCRCMDLERIGQITEKHRPTKHYEETDTK
jgi:hypothetical protein